MPTEQKNLEKSNSPQFSENIELQAETSKLWQQYSKKAHHKNIKHTVLLTFVFFILFSMVIIGLYIILSTTDPTHSK